MSSEGELKKRIRDASEASEYGYRHEYNGLSVDETCDILDEAKKDFPVHFKMDTVSGGEYDAETDSFTPQIVTTEILENLNLKQYQANAFVNKDEIINWFKKWFGADP